ncbi:hypothetical protein [Vibrio anguillarum]|uniref:Uncharacterized protein n=1 Tax=Vibrio anguillarum TaxID=55601 RepID=A0AAW4BI01_VIBAN|nr:hypothetical protein [Vibrio anguillarum]MBF4374404.1 hypothetical protein [Vibrio anguillarum]MBF4437675.1 hypothetical protein [Vibrio anguillarum]
MEDIEQLIKKEQWLAKDRFDFSQKQGVQVGVNIFDKFKFQACKFTLFESLLSKLDNDSLCQAFDYFERERLRVCFQDHFNKTKTPINVVEKIVYLYVKALLIERVKRDVASDIPSVRSEIDMYARTFPNLDSNVLISEFRKSEVQICSDK